MIRASNEENHNTSAVWSAAQVVDTEEWLWISLQMKGENPQSDFCLAIPAA
jgi:hypothetical protein